MKVSILGTSSGRTELNKHLSSVYIGHQEKAVLFDCGEGTSHQVQRYKLDGDFLDAVVISHYHPDHISGIYMLIQLLYLQRRKKELAVYLPERVDDFIKTLNLFYLFTDRLTYPIHFYEMEQLSVDIASIQVIPNAHLQGYQSLVRDRQYQNEIRSFSYFLREGNQGVLYSSDLMSCQVLYQYLAETDLLIIDGQHPSLEELVTLNNLVRGKIQLTHGYSEALAQLCQKYPKYSFAKEGTIIEM